ncbi:hypothetical protein [Pseudooceanicola sp.]|uniref:hypothetical protein n=1 Tax=Pseudooceanicola sp. TaxID=1914328 RepID=UPI0035C7419E
MFRRTMTALGFSLVAATPALAVDGPFPVAEIETDTYFEAMTNSNALQFYPDVAVDLANAIRQRVALAGDDDPRTLDVDVQITAMRLNDNPVLVNDGEFNILEGVVTLRDTVGGEDVRNAPIILRAEEMDVPYTSVSPDNRDFYTAMVYTFAERVAQMTEEVDELQPIGEIRN